jgi:Fic family protein
MFIYEQVDWPNFFWDQKILSQLLSSVRYQQGHLTGGMKSIGFPTCDNVLLKTLTEDVVKSSEIEGEILDNSLVRSSVARHLGMDIGGPDTRNRNIEGVVEMVLDATQHFQQPLTKKRLFKWHASLFPQERSSLARIRVGDFRKNPVEVISGAMGKEKVHFVGPPAARLEYEMDRFLDWLNQDLGIDLTLKAAISHLWFLTIHPFDDGNGRIGRAIADYLLARSENSSRRYYSLSAQIRIERSDYYTILEQTQKGTLDITPWVKWFFFCLERSIKDAMGVLDTVINKTRFWKGIANIPLNERQKKIITMLLDDFKGNLTSTKWAKITKCSQDTAYRDILDLVDQGILIKNPEGGRSSSYSLTKTFSA